MGNGNSKKDPGDNWLLNKVRKNQTNPKNKSKTSAFVKRQMALQKALEDGFN